MRRAQVFLAVLLPLALVPGSSAFGSDAGASEGGATILWSFWGNQEEVATHQKVADAFMNEHPEIHVETMHETWDAYFPRLQGAWAGGDQDQIPDVAFVWPVQRYAAEGVLEDLSPYIADSGYDLSQYWPNLIDSAMWDGRVYGLPRDVGVEVLYFNKAMFDDSGLSYPDDTWTWDDLSDAAERLTVVEEDGSVSRYGLAMETGKVGLWLVQNGATVLDDHINPSMCTLTDPAAVEAIAFFGDMLREGHAALPQELQGLGGDTGAFLSGSAAMIVQNMSRVSALNAAAVDYDVAPVPYPADGRRASVAGGASWVMSAGSANKEAAWTFLQWLQSPTGGQAIYVDSGEMVPAVKAAAYTDAFLDPGEPPENRQAFITEAENGGEQGRFGFFSEWDAMNAELIEGGLQQVWEGDVTAAEAAADICAAVDAFLAEHGYPR